MSIVDNIVVVEIRKETALNGSYYPAYCILVNATAEQVIECAVNHHEAFVFTFDTTPVDKIKTQMLDYTPLHPQIEEYVDEWGYIQQRCIEGSYKPWMDRLMDCLYIGNFSPKDHKSVIDQFVESVIGKTQNLVYSQGYDE